MSHSSFTPDKLTALLPVMQAFAERKPIQFKLNVPAAKWQPADPNFSMGFDLPADCYRVSPTALFRVALMRLSLRDGLTTMTVRNDESAEKLQQNKQFVRWVTDWIEVSE